MRSVDGRVFGADGRWWETEWFKDAASDFATPGTIETAVEALRPIFTAEWARQFGPERHELHPFEAAYRSRGSVRDILQLGAALAITGSPAGLTKDLLVPARYTSRYSELWAGALFREFGAEVEFVPEDGVGKKPEFLAHFPDQAVAVEAKDRDYARAEGWFARVSNEHQAGVWEAFRESPGRGQELRSRASITPPLKLMADIALSRDESRVREVFDRGRATARRWFDFDATSPKPGRYDLGDGLEVEMLSEGDNCARQNGGPIPRPPPDFHWRHIRRKQMSHAAAKFDDTGTIGIVVLGKPFFQFWRDETLSIIAQDLFKGAPWSERIGALLLRHSIPQIPWSGEGVICVAGPRWRELPERFRTAFPSCGECCVGHREFDVLKSELLVPESRA